MEKIIAIIKKVKFDEFIKYTLALYIISLFVFNNISGNSTNYVSLILFLVCLCLTLTKCLKEKKIKLDKNFIFYTMFILLGLISFIYALNKGYVINKTIQLVINLAIIFIFNNFLNSKINLEFVLKSFACAGIIIALLILFTTDYSEITRLNRAGTQIGNVNSLAIQMFMALSAILILKNGSNNNKKWKYILVELLLILAILLTGSRKGIIAVLALYVLTYIIKDLNNKKVMMKNLGIIILIIAILTTLVYIIPDLHELVWVRFENLFSFIEGKNTNEFSINARNNMIEVGLEWFKSKPILGYGLDNYRNMYDNAYGYDYYAHNNYVEILVDLGIIGVLVYYLIILYPLIKLLKMKIYNKYETCVFFSVLIITLIMDFAWVSYGDRVWIIYLTIIYAYISINKKRRRK